MTVQAWLDSERDYEVGRQLYEQLGDNARLKQVLGHGPSAYNREALEWELGKLAKAGIVTSIVTTNVTAVAPADMPKKVQDEEAASQNAMETLQNQPVVIPPEAPLLLELMAARRPLYDERTLQHAQLEVLAEHGTQVDVRGAAMRIMNMSRELNANWKTDAYVRVHGQLPPAPAPTPGLDTLAPDELLKKRNNLRSQVSKLKKRTDRADDLARVEALLLQVETLLNPAK
jgi:hypothetical protein